MDANKRLKISRYVFGAGLIMAPLQEFTSFAKELDSMVLYLAGCLIMAVGLYLNLKAKGLNPFKKKRFYGAVLVLTIVPISGPLAVIGIMFGTQDPAAPMPAWRKVLFSPAMLVLYCFIAFGLIAYPQTYQVRARGAHASFKVAQRHFALAKESESTFAPIEVVRKEIDEAADALVSARRSAFTDANTNWYLRYFLSSSIVKESELAGLEAAIGAAKASGHVGDLMF